MHIDELSGKLSCLTTYAGFRASAATAPERSLWEQRAYDKEIASLLDKKPTELSKIKSSGSLTEEQQTILATAYDFEVTWPEWCEPGGTAQMFMRKLLETHFSGMLSRTDGDGDWNFFSASLRMSAEGVAADGASIPLGGALRFKERSLDDVAAICLTQCEFIISSRESEIASATASAGKSDPKEICIRIINDNSKNTAWEISNTQGLKGIAQAEDPPWCFVQRNAKTIVARVRARWRDTRVVRQQEALPADNYELGNHAIAQQAFFKRFPVDPELKDMRVLGTYPLRELGP